MVVGLVGGQSPNRPQSGRLSTPLWCGQGSCPLRARVATGAGASVFKFRSAWTFVRSLDADAARCSSASVSSKDHSLCAGRRGEIGRRKGLKIPTSDGGAGSSPAAGTMYAMLRSCRKKKQPRPSSHFLASDSPESLTVRVQATCRSTIGTTEDTSSFGARRGDLAQVCQFSVRFPKSPAAHPHGCWRLVEE